MTDNVRRRDVLGVGAATFAAAVSGCSGTTDDQQNTDDTETNGGDSTDDEDETDSDETESMPSTPLNGDVEQQGELTISSPQFEAGERLPDSAGYVNDNANPELEISGVPDDAAALVLAVDDPEAQPVAGHTWDHWFVWDIDPDIGTIPEGWDASGATEGYNDFMEQGYGGPSPPEGSHGYRFKLLAIDSELDVPAETRKTRVGSAVSMNAEVLAATQIVGEYHAEQGTAF